MVLDAEDAGWGCSSRNGGQISTSIKPGFDELSRRHGSAAATGILREGRNALAWIETFVRDEAINCDFGVVGRFNAAHTPAKLEELAHDATHQPKGL